MPSTSISYIVSVSSSEQSMNLDPSKIVDDSDILSLLQKVVRNNTANICGASSCEDIVIC